MRPFRLVLLIVSAVAWPVAARAAVVLPPEFATSMVASGLDRPVNFDFLPDGRVLLVEQKTGRIRLARPDGGGAPASHVGTVSDVRSEGSDEGLLGIAVDPRWPASPYLYVHHASAYSPNIRIARYALAGDLDGTGDGTLALDSLSRRDVLGDLPNDSPLHDGGTIEFGPDGMLHVALGDDFVRCSAQDVHQLRGKILRLDVRAVPDGPGPILPYAALAPPDNPYIDDPDPRARLVWHLGLRNPWTFDIDPRTGAMAIADVGEATWEEVDVPDLPGRNFGWPLFEGPEVFDPNCQGLELSGLTVPAYAYERDSTAASCILGGFCFRADDVGRSFPPEYWGNLFFLDFFEGRLRRLVPAGGDGWEVAPPVAGQPEADAWGTGFSFVPRMRFGHDGGLWYLQGPNLWRIAYQGVVGVPGVPASRAGTLALAARPSPSNGPVTLEFRLEAPARAEVVVFDVAGRRVRSLGTGSPLEPGLQRLTWDGRSDDGVRVRPGVYLARVAAGESHAQARVVVVAPLR